MKYSHLYLAFLVFLGSCQSPSTEIEPTFAEKKQVLLVEGAEEHLMWNLSLSNDWLKENSHEIRNIKAYQDTLQQVLGTELFREMKAFEAASDLPASVTDSIKSGPAFNAALVHSGIVGKIRPMRTIEAQLLSYQLSRYPLFSHPTEFHAFMMVDKKEENMTVFFCSSDQPWPPKPYLLREKIDSIAHHDWKLKYHLHNHFGDENDNYFGRLAPSLADAHYFKMLASEYNVEAALITNGFLTVEIPQSDFKKFDSH